MLNSADIKRMAAEVGFDACGIARADALEMIRAAWRYVYGSDLSLEELKERIGNRSYLSGLPVDDPRNTAVSFLLPPQKEERTGRK